MFIRVNRAGSDYFLRRGDYYTLSKISSNPASSIHPFHTISDTQNSDIKSACSISKDYLLQ